MFDECRANRSCCCKERRAVKTLTPHRSPFCTCYFSTFCPSAKTRTDYCACFDYPAFRLSLLVAQTHLISSRMNYTYREFSAARLRSTGSLSQLPLTLTLCLAVAIDLAAALPTLVDPLPHPSLSSSLLLFTQVLSAVVFASPSASRFTSLPPFLHSLLSLSCLPP